MIAIVIEDNFLSRLTSFLNPIREKKLDSKYLTIIKDNDLNQIFQLIKTEELFKSYIAITENFHNKKLIVANTYDSREFQWRDEEVQYTFNLKTGLSIRQIMTNTKIEVNKYGNYGQVYDKKNIDLKISTSFYKEELVFWETLFDYILLSFENDVKNKFKLEI